ncbi:MAG: hypothetical protein OEU49_14940 [Chromatiales bacterium]|nr:hypothetical protein [Chromatiales bacterium]
MGSGGWVLLLGWPAVLAAVVAFSLAVARRSRTAAIAGCLLAGPMFSYLSLAPRFHWIAPVAFGLLCILAWRVKRSGRLAVFLLALPAMILVAWLAYAVLTQ